MVVLFAAPAAGQQTPEELLQSALYKQQVEGDLEGAVEILQTLVEDFAEHREIAASALVLLGRVHETLGSANAERAYRRVLNDYPDQRGAVTEARARLALLAPATLPDTEGQGPIARQVCSSLNSRDPTDDYGWQPCGGVWEQISPNGRYVARTNWGGLEGLNPRGDGGLVVYDLQTREFRPVATNTSEYVMWILWSRDEQRLVYSNYEHDYSHVDLHIVNLDGTDHRPLIDDLPSFGDGAYWGIKAHAWSAKGDFIVASLIDRDDVSTIALVSVDDGSIRPLKRLPGEADVGGLSLSPDGRYIAYDYPQASGDEHDLFVLAVDGSRDERIAPHTAHDSRPVWTPDGGHIVFLSDRSGRTDLWAMEVVDGRLAGEPEVIRPDVGEIKTLGFTEDGALAYWRDVSESDVYVADMDWARGSFVEEATRLSDRFVGTNRYPAWSPDGSRIAYLSQRDGPGAQNTSYVVVKSLEDGAERDIELRLVDRPSGPAWSADGRQIRIPGWYSDETGPDWVSPRRAGFSADIETGEVQRDPFMHDWTGWRLARFATGRQSEGLRSLGIRLAGQQDFGAYVEDQEPLRPGEKLLWIRGAIQWVHFPETGTDFADLEFEEVGPVGVWDLSPDGTTLALCRRNGAWVMPLAEMEARQVWDGGEEYRNACTRVRWMPDGRHLLLAAHPVGARRDEFRFLRVALAGGEAEILDLPFGAETQLMMATFKPDGSRIAFDLIKRGSEVWTLSGFPWDEVGGR
jgi:Tol biopolymer transport system component